TRCLSDWSSDVCSSDLVGAFFLVFLAIIIVFSIALFIFRLPRLRPEQEFDSVVSREGIFLVNNLLLVGIAFATLWGTIFPLISRSEERRVGKEGSTRGA